MAKSTGSNFEMFRGIGSKINKEGKKIKDDIPFKKLVILGILIDILVITLIFSLRNFLPPEVPLFYGLPEGAERLGNIYLLALPSVASLGIILLNIFIGLIIKDEFLTKTLVLSGLATVFFSGVTTLKIIFLVGSFKL